MARDASDLTEDGELLITPRDAFGRRAYLAPLGLMISVDGARIERLTLLPSAHTVTVELSPHARAPSTAATLLLEVERVGGAVEVAVEAIKKHGAVYLMAVGGAAYLVSQAVTKAEVVAFDDLGMEAIYAFTVKDMPVSVAVDSQGESVHITGPRIWKAQIEELALELI